MEPDADVRAPRGGGHGGAMRALGSRAAMPAGAAPCQRGRRRRRVARADPVQGRARYKGEAQRRIDQARSGQLRFPDGLPPHAAPHKLVQRGLSRRTDHAERLIRS